MQYDNVQLTPPMLCSGRKLRSRLPGCIRSFPSSSCIWYTEVSCLRNSENRSCFYTPSCSVCKLLLGIPFCSSPGVGLRNPGSSGGEAAGSYGSAFILLSRVSASFPKPASIIMLPNWVSVRSRNCAPRSQCIECCRSASLQKAKDVCAAHVPERQARISLRICAPVRRRSEIGEKTIKRYACRVKALPGIQGKLTSSQTFHLFINPPPFCHMTSSLASVNKAPVQAYVFE